MTRFRSLLVSAVLAGLVSACASQPADNELVSDPLEGLNRATHILNKGVDQAVLRPASQAYSAVTPDLIKMLFGNAVNHLQLPGVFVNHVLQGDSDRAVNTLGRFVINTVGGAGVLDPATEGGLPAEPTDFGLTLATWGVGEGAYIELPFFGPSTARDAVGLVVDSALQPTTYLTGGTEVQIATAGVRALTIVDARDRNAVLIDNLLYETEDSYVSLRANYIQNRRRRAAGGETDVDALPDLFSE
ncbi:MAG: VacJ family lipoprotein [Pseudomonadota bacterium]